MEAVIAIGGKQYLVQKNAIIKTELVKKDVGEQIVFDDAVLATFSEDGKIVDKVKVTAEVLDNTRDKKIIVLKKKRRQGYRRKYGFRKEISILKIVDFE